jgi:hypothetical protein
VTLVQLLVIVIHFESFCIEDSQKYFTTTQKENHNMRQKHRGHTGAHEREMRITEIIFFLPCAFFVISHYLFTYDRGSSFSYNVVVVVCVCLILRNNNNCNNNSSKQCSKRRKAKSKLNLISFLFTIRFVVISSLTVSSFDHPPTEGSSKCFEWSRDSYRVQKRL